MKIANVEFVGLRSPLQPPARFSWGMAEQRNVGLIKVVTDEGTVGWGETSVTFPLWSLEERHATVTQGLGPLVTGLPCGTVEEIRAVSLMAESSMSRLRSLWSSVGISAAIGALEQALLDALGKTLNTPVWELLGGSVQPIDLYAVGFTGGPKEAADQAAAALEEGYAAVKIRVGFGEEADIALVETFRTVLGDKATILADANMGWDTKTAERMAERLRPYGLGWLEEPVDRENTKGLASVRTVAGTPIAAGENCYSGEQLVELANSGLVDILMPDISRCGGFLAALEGASAALAKGLQYSTHHYASDIGSAAMASLCSIAGASAPILRDISAWPLREEILPEPLNIVRGKLRAYEGPGLAPEPDPVVIERTRVL